MTAKKQITIDVPAGLPDGWEVFGYEMPKKGEMLYSPSEGWIESAFNFTNDRHLIARRTETAADWANKQPKLLALAGMVKDGAMIELWESGRHRYQDEEGSISYIYAEGCDNKYNGEDVKAKSGKWVNA